MKRQFKLACATTMTLCLVSATSILALNPYVSLAAQAQAHARVQTQLQSQSTTNWRARVHDFLISLKPLDIRRLGATSSGLENRFLRSRWASGTTRNEVYQHVQLYALIADGVSPVVVATTTSKTVFGPGDEQFLYTYTPTQVVIQSTVSAFGHTLTPAYKEAATGLLDGRPSILATGFHHPHPTSNHEVRVVTWNGHTWRLASSIRFTTAIDVDKVVSVKQFDLFGDPDEKWQFHKASGSFWYLPTPTKSTIPNFSFGPGDLVHRGNSVILWGWMPPNAAHSFVMNIDPSIASTTGSATGLSDWVIPQEPNGTFRTVEKIPATAKPGTYQLSVVLANAGDSKEVVEGWLSIVR